MRTGGSSRVIESVGDLFVGTAKHQIDDHHLFALGEVTQWLDIGVGSFRFLIDLLYDDKQRALPS